MNLMILSKHQSMSHTMSAKMMEAIKDGMDANEAVKKFTGYYGRTTAEQGIVKAIDPRKE